MRFKKGQTQQFDTFDNIEDRREIFILFERLGDGLSELMQNRYRAKFLEMLMTLNIGNLPPSCEVSPCRADEAFRLFIQIVGVLGVPISDAVALLEEAVRLKAWQKAPEFFQERILDRCDTVLGAG